MLACLALGLCVISAAGIDVVGHRGFSGTAPENTMVAVNRAFDIPGGHVEVDLRVTSDNVLVLMHDDTVDRTTNGRGNVRSLTLEYIQTLDAGSWKGAEFAGERVPTLREVLTNIRSRPGTPYAILDCKSISFNLLGLLAEVMQDYVELAPHIIVGCWDQTCLSESRRLNPLLKTVLIAAFPPAASTFPTYRSLGTFAFSIGLSIGLGLSESFTRNAQSNSFGVYGWTANSEADIRKLVTWRVNGIIGDYPDRTYRIINGGKGAAVNTTTSDHALVAGQTSYIVRGCLDYLRVGAALPDSPSPAEAFFAASAACAQIGECPVEGDGIRLLIEDTDAGAACARSAGLLRTEFLKAVA